MYKGRRRRRIAVQCLARSEMCDLLHSLLIFACQIYSGFVLHAVMIHTEQLIFAVINLVY